jgi:hypothetical protein
VVELIDAAESLLVRILKVIDAIGIHAIVERCDRHTNSESENCENENIALHG